MTKYLLFVFLFACGRYAPPVAPEYLAPAVVNNPIANMDAGIRISWDAPKNDVQGKRLKQIDGYEIYRRAFSETEYTKIAFVADSHLIELQRLQDEAKKAGKPIRKVRVPREKTHFEYVDAKYLKNEKYFYAVVPLNDTDIRSEQIKYFLVNPAENLVTPDDFGGIPLEF